MVRTAETSRASSLRETRELLERSHHDDGDSDHHDDMRRADDDEDGYRPSNMTRLVSIAFRSGQAG